MQCPRGRRSIPDPYLLAPSELIFDISAAKPQAQRQLPMEYQGDRTAGRYRTSSKLSPRAKRTSSSKARLFRTARLPDIFTLANGSQNLSPRHRRRPRGRMIRPIRMRRGVFCRRRPLAPVPMTSRRCNQWVMPGAGSATSFPYLPATHATTAECTGQSVFGPDRSLSKSVDWFNTWWQNSVTAPDQWCGSGWLSRAERNLRRFRERRTILVNHADSLAAYYDMLIDHAFGNYRT